MRFQDKPLWQHRFFRERKWLGSQRLYSGLNHYVHKVDCEDITVIVRRAKNPKHTSNELQLQQELAHQDITAEVFDYHQGSGIMAYIDGEHPQPDKWQNDKLDLFARRLVILHRYRPTQTVATLQLPCYINQCIEQTSLTDEQQGLCRQALEKLRPLYTLPLDLGLCHQDLNPKNIIFSHHQIWLIDWESAAFNDVFFDLASFIVEQQLDLDAERYFVDCYLAFAFPDRQFEQVQHKLKLMKLAYCLICWLWYIEYDRQNHNNPALSTHFALQLRHYSQN